MIFSIRKSYYTSITSVIKSNSNCVEGICLDNTVLASPSVNNKQNCNNCYLPIYTIKNLCIVKYFLHFLNTYW